MNTTRLPTLFASDPFAFDDAFRSFMRPYRWEPAADVPQIRLDVTEADEAYTVKAEIPGVRKEDIDVQIDGAQVTISAEVKKDTEEKKDGRVLRSERQYGYASRSFTLACDVDDGTADAKYQDGVLSLSLPKKAMSTSKKLSIA
jgi:HSP20 family protein